jgi:uncharacterized protein
MFVGRKYELAELEKYFKEGAFQFAVFYGRRRVGKTTLINKFRENKKSIHFTAVETTAKENLELLSVQILDELAPQSPKNPFMSFLDAFEYCFKAAARKRLVLVIDEYPYLAESDRAVSSILQTLIDKYRESSRLFLILCGSSMSFMENQVLGYKSPLYGRRTCQFKIQPLNYYESARMLPAFNNIEKISLYGIVGGVPEYLSRINNKISLAQNIESLFFNPSGRLFEEPSNLLKQELQSPQTYNGIIAAIASGACKVNEIASRAGIETSQCSNMLGTLTVLGIVKKEYPAGSVKPSRKTIYRLSDNMFRFWYRFVLPELSRISMGYGKQACAEIFGRSESGGVFETYMGPVFEDCSVQYLWRSAKNNSRYKYIGRWWGPNPKEKHEEEINILAADGRGNTLFGECKWRNNRMGNDVLEELVRKSGLFPAALKKKYILFSKSGFTAELVKTAKQRGDTELVNLAQLLIE